MRESRANLSLSAERERKRETDLHILNGAGALSLLESKVGHLVDIWSFVWVWLQHVPCH